MNKVFLQILSIIAIILLSGKMPVEAKERPKWIDKPPTDTKFYWGTGQAPIKDNDTGMAIETANDRADAEIAKQIRVYVIGEMENVTRFKISEMGKTVAKEVVEEFYDKVKTIVDENIKGIELVDRFIDEEKKEVWVLKKLSKKLHEESIKDELKKKGEVIEGFIRSGLEESGKDETLSIKNLILAYDWLIKLFGNIPFFYETEGADREMHSFLRLQVDKKFSMIEVVPLDKKVIVSRGGAKTKFAFELSVKKDSEKSPLVSMPVKFSFAEGDGQIDNQGMSGSKGIVEAKIYSIGKGFRQAALKAEIDLRQLVGDLVGSEILGLFKNVPSGEVSAIRQPAVGYKGGFESLIEEEVIKKGYEAVKLSEGTPDYSSLFEGGIDYVIEVKTATTTNFISGLKMYGAEASAEVSLVQTITGSRIFVKSGGTSKGFGTSEASASSDAAGKLSGSVKRLIREAIEKI